MTIARSASAVYMCICSWIALRRILMILYLTNSPPSTLTPQILQRVRSSAPEHCPNTSSHPSVIYNSILSGPRLSFPSLPLRSAQPCLSLTSAVSNKELISKSPKHKQENLPLSKSTQPSSPTFTQKPPSHRPHHKLAVSHPSPHIPQALPTTPNKKNPLTHLKKKKKARHNTHPTRVIGIELHPP